MLHLSAPDEEIWVGVLRLSLMVPGSRSLKDKRRAVARIRDRIRARQNLSVAEVGHLEHRSRAILAVALIANDPSHIRAVLDSLVHAAAGWGPAHIEGQSISVFRPNEPTLGADLLDI